MTDDAELRKPPHPPPFSGNSVAALGQQQTAGNARPGPLCSAEVGLLLPVLQAFQVLTAPSLQVFTQTRAPQRGIRNPCHTPAHMPWESLSSWAGSLHEAGLWVPWPPEQRSARAHPRSAHTAWFLLLLTAQVWAGWGIRGTRRQNGGAVLIRED